MKHDILNSPGALDTSILYLLMENLLQDNGPLSLTYIHGEKQRFVVRNWKTENIQYKTSRQEVRLDSKQRKEQIFIILITWVFWGGVGGNMHMTEVPYGGQSLDRCPRAGVIGGCQLPGQSAETKLKSSAWVWQSRVSKH